MHCLCWVYLFSCVLFMGYSAGGILQNVDTVTHPIII